MARLVVPGYPHHVTQRGSRRQLTFFDESDYTGYLELLRESIAATGVDIWAYCLMPNHVHLVAVPAERSSLAMLLRRVHHRHARRVNEAHGWQGHLWQERFHSCVMDERHLVAAVRYIELNPVRAGLCARAEHWPWSSIHAHLLGESDGIVDPDPMLARFRDWRRYLEAEDRPEVIDALRARSASGRPAGDTAFITELEQRSGRVLRKLNPGPRPRN
jgi:putative transposase